MRSTLSQGQSKNIVQEFGGFSYLGNPPCILRATSGSLAAAATTAVGTAPLDGAVQGILVKVTTTVAGGDSTLQLKLGGVDVGDPLVIPEDTEAGEVLRFDFTEEPLAVAGGDSVGIAHDAVPSAGVAFLTVLVEPF